MSEDPSKTTSENASSFTNSDVSQQSHVGTARRDKDPQNTNYDTQPSLPISARGTPPVIAAQHTAPTYSLEPPLHIQSSTTPSPAENEVLGINELFELILLRLDMKTLLLSQRVDSHWRDTISSSTLLQKKLFFLPATLEELPQLNIVEDGANRAQYTHRREDTSSKDWHNITAHNRNISKTRKRFPEPYEYFVHNTLLVERAPGRLESRPYDWEPAATPGLIPPSSMKMLLLQPPSKNLTFKACGSYWDFPGPVLLKHITEKIDILSLKGWEMRNRSREGGLWYDA